MRNVIVHGHIFKNAGTTFDWSLARCLGDGFLDHRDDTAMREGRAEHLAELLETTPGLKAISSHHLCYPLPAVSDVTFHPVYFLRHPIERIASVYAFERRQDAQTRGALAAKEKSFKEYVAWRLREDVPRTVRDYQTANIAGFHELPVRVKAKPEWLRTASDRIANSSCIGVVDRYDESMVVFEHALSPLFPDIDLAYVAQNVSQERKAKGLSAGVKEVLDELGDLAVEALIQNAYDMALYRQATQKLDSALDEIDDVDARLADFRKRCARLSRRRWLRL